jgi:hypothetical protein
MQKIALLLCIAISTLTKTSAQETVRAANAFLSSLDSHQKSETLFPFDDDERYNFHFIPRERKGITFNELNDAQKKLAIALMKTSIGDQALHKAQEIMQLELVLKAIEKRKPEDHYRDPGNYHISIFGVPGPGTIWGWRFEGHHVSFNFSIDQNRIVSGTPGFLGSNPAIVLDGPQKGKQVLKEETETGLALLHSLTPAQLQKTVTDTTAPPDILSFNKRKLMLENPTGISYAELNPSQQQLMRQLINLYVHRFTRLFADDMLKEIQVAGMEKLWFNWTGKTAAGPGNPHYYRVQGPTLLIEYDNTQNNGNHVHSVVRDLLHDFGGDELLEHYQNAHRN